MSNAENKSKPRPLETDVYACHATMSQVNRRTGEREIQNFVQVTVGNWYKELDFGSDFAASVDLHRVINAGADALTADDEPEEDRTQPPEGWTLSPPAPCDPDQWACVRDDDKQFAYGRSRELAIAAAWAEVDRPDLHAIGARMAVESLRSRHRDHGEGFVLVMGNRNRPPDEDPSWEVFIVTTFGANFTAIAQMVQYENEVGDDLGIGHLLPDCNMCEALCRVVYHECDIDGPFGTQSTQMAGLEIVQIDGKPAVEIYD